MEVQDCLEFLMKSDFVKVVGMVQSGMQPLARDVTKHHTDPRIGK